MCEDLGWVAVGLKHHCAQTRYLERWNAAADIGKRDVLITGLSRLARLSRQSLIELELSRVSTISLQALLQIAGVLTG